MAKKRLSTKRSVAKDLTQKNKVIDLKKSLQKLDLSDMYKAEHVLQVARSVFPQMDSILCPEDMLRSAGLNDAVVDAIFDINIGSSSGCSNCHATCQNCHSCQSCDLCYTCQKEMAGSENLDFHTHEGIIRNQLMQVIQALSMHL